MFTKLVICEVGETEVWVERVRSSAPIRDEDIIRYYETERRFDWDKDSITIDDDIRPGDVIDLDALKQESEDSDD